MNFTQNARRRFAPSPGRRRARAVIALFAAMTSVSAVLMFPVSSAQATTDPAARGSASSSDADPTAKPEQSPVDVPDVNPSDSPDPSSEVTGTGPLLVIGIGGLTWDDIDPTTTPALWRLAERSALGNLTVRTVRSNTCAIDGWLTLGAGRRAGTELAEDQTQRCPAMPKPAIAPAGTGVTGAASGSGSDAPKTADGTAAAPAVIQDFSAYTAFNAAQDYAARPGTLSAALAVSGGKTAGTGTDGDCSLAIGPGAAAALADTDGSVGEYLPAGSVPTTLGSCRMTAVDLGSLGDSHWLPAADTTVAVSGSGDPGNVLDPAADAAAAAAKAGQPTTANTADPATGAGEPLTAAQLDKARTDLRARQLKAADTQLQRYLDVTPPGTAVMVLGLSDSQTSPRLGAVMVSQPYGNEGLLTSQSTRRSGLIQLTDIAPTVLNMIGLPRYADFVGTPAAYAEKDKGTAINSAGDPGTAPGPVTAQPDDATLANVDALRAQAKASTLIQQNAGTFSVLLDAAHYLFYVLLGLGLFAGWRNLRLRTEARSARRATQLAWIGFVLGAVPTATFLAAPLPWASSAAPLLTLAGGIIGATVLLVAVSLAGPWRRNWLGRVGALGCTTAAILGADVATGSHLQLNSFLGYNPIVGGRFYGLGNMAVALFIVGALMGSAALVTPLIRAGLRRRAAVIVAVIGAVSVGVLGNPAWGAKFGGTIAALGGFIVLVLMLLKVRLNIRRLLLIGVIALLTLLGIAGLDYLRPADQRSHFGLFFGQLLDGEFFGVLGRKLAANISIVSINPLLSIVVPCGLLAIGLFLGWLKRWPRTRMFAEPWAGRLVAITEAVPTLWPGFAATMLALLAGLVITDSGIAVPATGFMLLIPLLVAVSADLGRPGFVRGAGPGGSDAADRAGDPLDPSGQGPAEVSGDDSRSVL